jgi:hypothetical protein
MVASLASTEAFLPSAVGSVKLLIQERAKGRRFLWRDRGSDFSVGPMKLRRTYLVENEEYKNEQLTLRFLRFWASTPANWLLVPEAAPVKSV